MRWLLLMLCLIFAGCNMNMTFVEITGDENKVTSTTTSTDGGTDVGVTEPSYNPD